MQFDGDEGQTFMVCIRNDEWPTDLTVGKTYRVLPREPNCPPEWIRVIDDTEEDYLFPASYFRPGDARGEASPDPAA